jgi:hypothetical protein
MNSAGSVFVDETARLDFDSVVAKVVVGVVSAAVVGAVASKVREYVAQNRNRDMFCQDRWEHLTKHVLPVSPPAVGPSSVAVTQ